MALQVQTDIDAVIKAVALSSITVTAGGGADGVAQNSDSYDTLKYRSGALALVGVGSVSSSETATIEIVLQESADDSTFTDAETLVASKTWITGATSGALVPLEQCGWNASKYERYLRFKITVTFSAGATDTVTYYPTVIKGGAYEVPAA